MGFNILVGQSKYCFDQYLKICVAYLNFNAILSSLDNLL